MKWAWLIASLLALVAPLACNPQQIMADKPAMVAKLPMANDGIVRLSRIAVDPAYLEEYRKLAIEVGEASLRDEPGVLAMYALAERDNPCLITILEIYASQSAYASHIASDHFQKYKKGTLHMVKSLRLLDQTPLNANSEIHNILNR